MLKVFEMLSIIFNVIWCVYSWGVSCKFFFKFVVDVEIVGIVLYRVYGIVFVGDILICIELWSCNR